MRPTDREKFLRIVLGFAELKGKALSAPAIELFWNSMRHWQLDEFEAAAEQLLRTCAFMPTPKDFEDLRRAARPTAVEAWSDVRRYLEYTPHGYRVRPNTPPLMAKCIAGAGGANAIAMCEAEKLHFLERRFCQHFDELSEVAETRTALPWIEGSPLALEYDA